MAPIHWQNTGSFCLPTNPVSCLSLYPWQYVHACFLCVSDCLCVCVFFVSLRVTPQCNRAKGIIAGQLGSWGYNLPLCGTISYIWLYFLWQVLWRDGWNNWITDRKRGSWAAPHRDGGKGEEQEGGMEAPKRRQCQEEEVSSEVWQPPSTNSGEADQLPVCLSRSDWSNRYYIIHIHILAGGGVD